MLFLGFGAIVSSVLKGLASRISCKQHHIVE